MLVGHATAARASVHRYDPTASIHTRKQADRLLPGTPVSFRRAVASRGHRNWVYAMETCDLEGGVGVSRVDSRGFALVNSHSCGGASEIWARRTDRTGRTRWIVVTGTQEWWDCRTLLRRGVPKSVVAPDACYPASGTRSLPYEPKSDGAQYAR